MSARHQSIRRQRFPCRHQRCRHQRFPHAEPRVPLAAPRAATAPRPITAAAAASKFRRRADCRERPNPTGGPGGRGTGVDGGFSPPAPRRARAATGVRGAARVSVAPAAPVLRAGPLHGLYLGGRLVLRVGALLHVARPHELRARRESGRPTRRRRRASAAIESARGGRRGTWPNLWQSTSHE